MNNQSVKQTQKSKSKRLLAKKSAEDVLKEYIAFSIKMEEKRMMEMTNQTKILQEEARLRKEEAKRTQEEKKKEKEEYKKRMQEERRQMREEKKQLKIETKERDAKWQKEFGSFINNDGDVYEEFFANGIEHNNLVVDGIKFYKMHRNEQYEGREVDIFLTNGESIMVIEVKKKAHLNDLKKLLDETIPTVKKWALNNPDYKNFKLYTCLASFVFNEAVKQEAKKLGIILLGRSGKEMITVSNWKAKNLD